MNRNRNQYPDLRYKFIRGLIQKEQCQRRKQFLKNAAEWTSKAIVSLELTDQPIRSVQQAMKLDGIGKEISKELRIIQVSSLISDGPPKGGLFCSSASALLVALLYIKESNIDVKTNASGVSLVPEETLRGYAEQICEERFQMVVAQPDKNSNVNAVSGFCPAWWRMAVLIGRGFVKKRSLQKQAVYELLPEGEIAARKLVDLNPGCKPLGQDVRPSSMLNHKDTGAASSDHLYSNDDGSDGVILLVDTQEWGGDRVGLGDLIRLIQLSCLRCRTEKLPCADYQWVWRCSGTEYPLPVLVERKRADDLARSMIDGRYERQKENMLSWRDVFVGGGMEGVLKYLVEGKPEDYVVRCVDGCGSLVKCGFPTAPDVRSVMRDLLESSDFELLQTDNIEATVQVLALLTADLRHRVDQGDFLSLMNNNLGVVANVTASRRKQRAAASEKNNKPSNISKNRSSYGQVELLDIPLAQYHKGNITQKMQDVNQRTSTMTRNLPLKRGEIPVIRSQNVSVPKTVSVTRGEIPIIGAKQESQTQSKAETYPFEAPYGKLPLRSSTHESSRNTSTVQSPSHSLPSLNLSPSFTDDYLSLSDEPATSTKIHHQNSSSTLSTTDHNRDELRVSSMFEPALEFSLAHSEQHFLGSKITNNYAQPKSKPRKERYGGSENSTDTKSSVIDASDLPDFVISPKRMKRDPTRISRTTVYGNQLNSFDGFDNITTSASNVIQIAEYDSLPDFSVSDHIHVMNAASETKNKLLHPRNQTSKLENKISNIRKLDTCSILHSNRKQSIDEDVKVNISYTANKLTDGIKQVKNVLPNTDEKLIEKILVDNGCDVEDAVIHLLDGKS